MTVISYGTLIRQRADDREQMRAERSQALYEVNPDCAYWKMRYDLAWDNSSACITDNDIFNAVIDLLPPFAGYTWRDMAQGFEAMNTYAAAHSDHTAAQLVAQFMAAKAK